ncbi:hypothetical protein FIBSPDRAFT_880333 [Athelia psychrophila]|uniref:Uncharacterized protein n=1 Tax=Athelia psychrophila TaxID=1759441 RepID=A0A167T0Y8_9AGAM|nr:hypothetical protein FIBSPDRAFT_880333 [Fibularhizoctonia sp. CBS 109695]
MHATDISPISHRGTHKHPPTHIHPGDGFFSKSFALASMFSSPTQTFKCPINRPSI